MHAALRRCIAWAGVVMLAACGPFHHSSQADSVIVFRNQSSDQADVFALSEGGAAIRIGTVFPLRTETLRVPTSALGGSYRVNIIARIFASSRIVASGAFSLGPGDSMDVTLPPEENILSALPSRGQ
jgi:hypothetical protein